MSTQLKLRRGTTAQHSTFTGAEGEVTVDTTKDTLVVHDGITAGGVPLAKNSDVVALTGNQTIAGTKTFSSAISGSISSAAALTTGRTIAVTGDVAYTSPAFDGTANVTAAATLATTGVTAGTYGSSSSIPVITVDNKGRATAVSSAIVSAGPPGIFGQVFTTSGTFTVPVGITAVKVTVIGGGGNGGGVTGSGSLAGGGGGGGVAIKYVTGLTPLETISATVGAVGGTSSFGAHCSATGGATAASVSANASFSAGGTAGAGSSGHINITGSPGLSGNLGSAGGGSDGSPAISNCDDYYSDGSFSIPGFPGLGGPGFFNGRGGTPIRGNDANGVAASGYGNGGSGARTTSTTDRTGGAGTSGIIIVEW